MKNILFFTFLFSGQLLTAQTFSKVPPASPFEGVESSSVVFSDVDGDGDDDLLIMGENILFESIAKLYINDDGNFTEVLDTPFNGFHRGSVAVSDVDGDGDDDLLITGVDSAFDPSAKLYTNDGGSFTEVMDTPFEGVWGSSVAFADVDGDGDNDLLITGLNSSGAGGQIAKLYTNEAGSFSEVMDTPFAGVWNSAVSFSDVDGDGDQDLLIVGETSSEELIAKLYTNNGGNFTEVSDTPFEGAEHGSVAFADVDGDGDSDLLITGQNSLFEVFTKLYTNDGGSFTEVLDTPFDSVYGSSIDFLDIDGDDDVDLLITGFITKLYTNEEGNFTELMGTPFEDIRNGSTAFSDVDGDGDQDLVLTGRNDSGERIAKLYINDGASFTELIIGTTIDGVFFSSVAFSDVDGDGDQDLLITGRNSLFEKVAKLYNNEAGKLIKVIGTPIEGVESGSIAFANMDGDGGQYLLITGQNDSGERIAKLYTNEMGPFTEVLGTPFEDVFLSSIAFADVDGDGDSDLLITGTNSSWMGIAKLYTNDGGSFTEVMDTPFSGVRNSAVAFSDVDGDGDQDLLITGWITSGEHIAKLYTNDGDSFTEVMDTPFSGVRNGAVAFSDTDGDGDSDLLITGQNSAFEGIAKLYSNNGGNFTEVMDTPFDGVSASSIAFSDVDGDGDNDLLITGGNNSGESIAKLYTNDAGNFTELEGPPFEGVRDGSVAFADVDGDGDNDLLITGLTQTNKKIAQLYANDGLTSSRDDLANEFRFEFTLYPNPAKANNLNIRYHAVGSGLVTIKVFDLNGRPVRQQQQRSFVGQQSFSVDITSLKKGSYFIQLDGGKVRGVRKFLIQ